jgi:hypothetical protein
MSCCEVSRELPLPTRSGHPPATPRWRQSLSPSCQPVHRGLSLKHFLASCSCEGFWAIDSSLVERSRAIPQSGQRLTFLVSPSLIRCRPSHRSRSKCTVVCSARSKSKFTSPHTAPPDSPPGRTRRGAASRCRRDSRRNGSGHAAGKCTSRSRSVCSTCVPTSRRFRRG